MQRRRFLAGLALAPAAALILREPPPPLVGGARHVDKVRYQVYSHRVFVPGASNQGVPLDVRASSDFTWQGGTLKVVSNQGVSGTATAFGRSYPLLLEANGGLGGFVGFGVLDPPGLTTIEAVVLFADGSTRTFLFPVDVQATQWTVDHIILPPPDPDAPPLTDEEIEEQAREREREIKLMATAYAGMSERKWDGKWIAPVVADITGYFGEQRSFNGGPVQGHHGGTDFGAWLGTPILATNSGTVVVAEWVITRGNMVIVDHGGGVFSAYCHMSEIGVVVGQSVAKGQVLGAVGTTGLSTGYHLHWEMSVGGVLVDGLRWLDGTQGF